MYNNLLNANNNLFETTVNAEAAFAAAEAPVRDAIAAVIVGNTADRRRLTKAELDTEFTEIFVLAAESNEIEIKVECEGHVFKFNDSCSRLANLIGLLTYCGENTVSITSGLCRTAGEVYCKINVIIDGSSYYGEAIFR